MIKFYAKSHNGWGIISQIQTFTFPAGEMHLKFPENIQEIETPVAALVSGTDVNDYIALAEWADLVHSQGQKAVALIPYLPGARADRGHPFGAKVYADLINMANCDQVICFDPHSHVITELVQNLTIVNSDHVIRDAVLGHSGLLGEYVGLIAPDAGAVERTERVGKTLGLPVFHAEKHRDFETGQLSGFSCEPLPEEGRLLIVDDICDGGGTFIGLAEATGVARDRIELWVSHGVFSGNAHKLTETFGAIHTTDSFPNARREDVQAHVISLLPYLFTAITEKND